jgi:hypothetical protein
MKSPDVSDAIRKSLDQAGLKDVSVAQDREKGVVTLAGHVAAEGDKSQASGRVTEIPPLAIRQKGKLDEKEYEG